MFELSIDPYCENCTEFEAKIDKLPFYAEEEMIRHDTIITCVHHERCNQIRLHIEREILNGSNRQNSKPS